MALGLPRINVIFKSVAASAFERGNRGYVALILKDTVPNKNPLVMNGIEDVPATGISAANIEQLKLAWKGYVNAPRQIIAYFLPADATSYNDALEYLEGAKWDYLAIPEIADADVDDIATWIKGMRTNKDIMVKAVLPNYAADTEGVINFATDNIVTAEGTYTAKQYCSRIAGLLAGTPLNMAATFATLPEVINVPRLTIAEFDAAIAVGKFVLEHDGEKVKVARAVNSLVTLTQDKKEEFQKIKTVDIMDLMHGDIKRTCQDYYIGKVSNSYEDKLVLATAIQAYFEQNELDRLLDHGKSSTEIDIVIQRNYLKSLGIDVNSMTDQQIKEANTRDKVFLKATVKILDAMEDITLNIAV